MPLALNYREVGQGDPVVIVHGLFGSASNWQSIAKRLADRWHLWLVDLRNHGESPHDDEMSYTAMAEDLGRFIDDHCGGRAAAIGHSMGGKAVMTLALNHPDKVSALAPVDVAPVAYSHRLTSYVDAMADIPLDRIERRRDADALLAPVVPEAHFRAFLLNNLRQRSDGAWYWRANLNVIAAHMDDIAGFPAAQSGQRYPGPVLFLHGGDSGYLREDHWPQVESLFPAARRVTVPGAGHWLHAEQPDPVAGHLTEFLSGA